MVTFEIHVHTSHERQIDVVEGSEFERESSPSNYIHGYSAENAVHVH